MSRATPYLRLKPNFETFSKKRRNISTMGNVDIKRDCKDWPVLNGPAETMFFSLPSVKQFRLKKFHEPEKTLFKNI